MNRCCRERGKKEAVISTKIQVGHTGISTYQSFYHHTRLPQQSHRQPQRGPRPGSNASRQPDPGAAAAALDPAP